MFVFVCKQTTCVFACVNAECVCVCVCVFRMFRMFVCVCMYLQTGSHYGALFGLQIEMLLAFYHYVQFKPPFLSSLLSTSLLTRKLFSIIFYKGILGPKALNKPFKYLGCIKSSSVVNCIGYSSRGPIFHSSYTIGCS